MPECKSLPSLFTDRATVSDSLLVLLTETRQRVIKYRYQFLAKVETLAFKD